MHTNYRRTASRSKTYWKRKASSFKGINTGKARAQQTQVLVKEDFDALDSFEPKYARGEDLWSYT